MDFVVYEDNPPPHGIVFKALPYVYALICVFLIIVYVTHRELTVERVLEMIGVALLIAVYYWAVSPRKYLIFDDRVKIVLGGPFSFTVPFDNLQFAREATGKDVWWSSFGTWLDFVTCHSSKHLLQITRKRGDKIYITPSNRDQFLEHLNKALKNWRVNIEVEKISARNTSNTRKGGLKWTL
jgi:hypothetical protein